MSTDQTHTHIETLVAELDTFRDELTKRPATADDRDRLAKMTDELDAAFADAEALKAADQAVAKSVSFLGSADEPAPIDVEHETGIAHPGGMSLGEAVAKSPGYAEFVSQFVGNDGQVMAGANVNKAVRFTPDGGSFFGKDLVTGLSSTSGGAFVENYRYGVAADLAPFHAPVVRDLCTVVPIQSDAFEYVRVATKTNNAAATAEATTAARPAVYDDPASGEKPESAMTTAVVTVPVETIAHYIPVTRRAAADGGQLSAIVDRFLRDGLADVEESQLLVGTGTTPQLQGILDAGTGIQTTGSAGTDIDAIVDAIRLIHIAGHKPNAMVIHPNDWYSTGFVMAKDGVNGSYLIGNPAADPTMMASLWGLQVVVTSNITENTALVGDFSQAVIADRQQATVYVTDSHQDWFARNILAVLAEERLGFGVLDPGAFCSVTAV